MGRLIDADTEIIKIMEISDKHSGVSGSKIFSALDVVRILEQAPTAYNVDKIVEQLKECERYIYDAVSDEDSYVIDTERAIEIVKGVVKDESNTMQR